MRTVATGRDGALVLETTSTRAAYVSDGDVLVSLSGDAAPDAVVTVDGTDVSDDFTANGDVRRGLVTGLADGESTIEAKSGDDTVRLVVTNHSKNGPLFAGPHITPWVCTTEAAGLGAATDADCDSADGHDVVVQGAGRIGPGRSRTRRRSRPTPPRPRSAARPCPSSSAPSKA